MTLNEAFKLLSKLNEWSGNELRPLSEMEAIASEIKNEYKQKITDDDTYLKAIYLLSFRMKQIKNNHKKLNRA